MTDSLAAASSNIAFAPDWPGLKLGVELALLAREESGASIAWRWRGALWLEAEALQRFARGVINASEDAGVRFPASDKDIPNFFPGHDANPPREPSTLGDAQALCAAIWALTPLHARYDEETETASQNNSAGPLHALQLPRSPGEAEGSGDFLRAVFCSARHVSASYLESRDPLTLAARSTLSALASLGSLEAGAWTEETEPAPDDWNPPWAHGGWDFLAIDQFSDLWRRCELSMASSRANPAPKSSTGRSL